MVEIKLKTKNNVIHRLEIVKGDDCLSTLDIFLKKHKLNFTDLYDISVECIDGEVMACRLAKTLSSALMFKIKGHQEKALSSF